MAHKRAVKATDLALALWQFGYNTKKGHEWKVDKYESKEDVIDAIYDEFWDIMREHGINIDELIN